VYEVIDDLLVSPPTGFELTQAIMEPMGRNRVAGQDS
jgi:hypothetical protein